MLKKKEWVVKPIEISIARRLVEKHHYAAGASNTATYLHGLFRANSFWDEECWGVAWWIPPTKSAALATYPARWQGVLSLSRLALVPSAPKNSCSYLISQSMRRIDRRAWPCLVTYADGWRGHEGGIYFATNWKYRGETKPERTYVKNGRMVARKRGGKTLTHAEMLADGAEHIGAFPKKKFVHLTKYAARRGDDSDPSEMSRVQLSGAAP